MGSERLVPRSRVGTGLLGVVRNRGGTVSRYREAGGEWSKRAVDGGCESSLLRHRDRPAALNRDRPPASGTMQGARLARDALQSVRRVGATSVASRFANKRASPGEGLRVDRERRPRRDVICGRSEGEQTHGAGPHRVRNRGSRPPLRRPGHDATPGGADILRNIRHLTRAKRCGTLLWNPGPKAMMHALSVGCPFASFALEKFRRTRGVFCLRPTSRPQN
jgi:hypothetical protein